jgi:hypothetical protein
MSFNICQQEVEMCADSEVDQLIAEADPQLWAHHFVLEQPLNSENIHSRVLEDVWHVMVDFSGV